MTVLGESKAVVQKLTLTKKNYVTIDELMLVQRRQVTSGDERTSSREPVVVNARHEAFCHWSFTGVTAPFVVQLTIAANGYELPSASDHHKPPSSQTFNRRF